MYWRTDAANLAQAENCNRNKPRFSQTNLFSINHLVWRLSMVKPVFPAPRALGSGRRAARAQSCCRARHREIGMALGRHDH